MAYLRGTAGSFRVTPFRPLTLIINLISVSDDLVAKKDHVSAAAIKKIERLRSDLENLQDVAEPVRQHFDARIRFLKNGLKSYS